VYKSVRLAPVVYGHRSAVHDLEKYAVNDPARLVPYFRPVLTLHAHARTSSAGAKGTRWRIMSH
jgi:hypothetical protein